jgi:hypothetical protein
VRRDYARQVQKARRPEKTNLGAKLRCCNLLTETRLSGVRTGADKNWPLIPYNINVTTFTYSRIVLVCVRVDITANNSWKSSPTDVKRLGKVEL